MEEPEEKERETEERAATPDGAGAPAIAPDEPPESETEPLTFPIVGIGASAGGLEAFVDIFDNLPGDTGMAFVVVSHLAPDQKSLLVEILGRHTPMPVVAIEHGMRPEPNHIYVLPPNALLTMSQGALELSPRPEGPGISMTIDHFFRSLAAQQKNRAIGVVLSGSDSDGALGLKTIKGEGGIAIVQNPDSARHPSMPRSSIAADHVDLIVPPRQIGAELARLGSQFAHSQVRAFEEAELPPGEETHLGRIQAMLRAVSGVNFRMYKPATLKRRIARRMMLKHVENLQEYAGYLHAHPEELRDLHEDVLINVTRFFRDPEVFEALKTGILPGVFENRPPDEQVRLWVAGCSTGEEVYSIAICLLEFLRAHGLEPPIQIFGTDASQLSIDRARTGVYLDSIAADISPERLRRFFVKLDKGYQVSKRIRDLCIFARQNLCNDPPFSRLDLVSCRNVLIYLSRALQKQIIPTFHYALRPNGHLLLGLTESIREFPDLFTMVDRQHKIYAKLVTETPVGFELPRYLLAPDEGAGTSGANLPGKPKGWSEMELQRGADRIVLARHGPPGVVINKKLEIQQTRGHTGPYLEMGPGASSFHLFRMIRDSIANQVRSAVQRAIEQDVPVRVPGIEARDGKDVHRITLEVLPIPCIEAQDRCYLVLFVPEGEDRAGAAEPPPEEAAAAPAEDERSPITAQLRRDLSSTRLYLQSMIEERDAKTQELISANEEVQSANEELQSSNEELETTKEELQSANEELQTVNEELQQRNASLTQTSNDLTNLLTSVNIPVLMLNNELQIRQFTPAARKLMNIRPGDIGRPIDEIRISLSVDDLKPVLREVLDTLSAREMEVRDREGRWYLMRVRPYRTTDNRIEGLVVVLVDVDEQRRGQQELREARDFAAAVIESVQIPLAILDMDLKIRTANAAFRALSGMPAENLEHHSFPELANLLWGIEPLTGQWDVLRRQAGNPASFEIEQDTSGPDPRVYCFKGQWVQADGQQVLLLTIEDITPAKTAERVLEREKQELEGEIRSATETLSRTQDELRALAASLFTSQEDERRWLARELHDDISQKLAVLEIDMEHVKQRLPSGVENLGAEIEGFRRRTAELSDEVRRISHRLHPSILEDLGLPQALKAAVQEFGEREGMIATFVGSQLPGPIPRETAGVLYRIAQEALRNVSKHAGKTHVKVTLEGAENGIRLQVADLGEGFDPADGSGGGLGLISMAERARIIGATFSVQSALGKGTTVTVEAPIERE